MPKTRFFIRILIFITLGAVSIVFADLFLFNKHQGHDPNWWHHNIFTTLAYWSPDNEIIDVTTLKSRHAAYMKEGIDLPASSFSNLPPPVTLATSIEEKTLSEIEPAAGNTGDYQDYNILGANTFDGDPEVGLSALGLDDADISDIFSPYNVEDAIISYGEVPEYEPVAIIPEKEKPAQKEELRLANIDEKAFEVYTHAPVEVEEDASEGDKYAYIKPEGSGKIAIIIDDMGLSLRSKLVEILPGPLTLSYLPYAENLKAHVKRAASNGHEIMVHIPMEPLNAKLDAGPHVLTVSQSREEMLDTLNWGLSQFGGYKGINNHMGSRMTTDKPGMDYIMAELKKRGLFFVDSRTINSSVAAQSARDAGIPYAVRDIFLDHEVTPDFINEALRKLENKAMTRGYAIAIGHPHKETIDALKEWLPTLEEKGMSLVPVSELLNQPVKEDAQAKAIWQQ